jgi:hypothetical protein
MNLLLSEILQKVSNAKTKEDKIKILQENNSDSLRAILIFNFDESIISLLPEGEVPFQANEAPKGTEHTRLAKEYRLLYNFVQGGNDNINKTRREMIFIQLLEGLHKEEADLLVLVKDGQLQKKYRITKNVVSEAFPTIKWGNRV